MKNIILVCLFTVVVLLLFLSCHIAPPQPQSSPSTISLSLPSVSNIYESSSIASSAYQSPSKTPSANQSSSTVHDLSPLDFTTQEQLPILINLMYATFGASPGEILTSISQMQPNSPEESGYILLCMMSTVDWESHLVEVVRFQEFSLLTFGLDILSLERLERSKNEETYAEGYISIWGAGFHNSYQITTLDYSKDTAGEIQYSFKCTAQYLDAPSQVELGSYQVTFQSVQGQYGVYAKIISCVEI